MAIINEQNRGNSGQRLRGEKKKEEIGKWVSEGPEFPIGSFKGVEEDW